MPVVPFHTLFNAWERLQVAACREEFPCAIGKIRNYRISFINTTLPVQKPQFAAVGRIFTVHRIREFEKVLLLVQEFRHPGRYGGYFTQIFLLSIHV
jgi:hypothetical protein